ncbi:hypothetical protein OGH69_06230 [Flavobacterium sp. MFBS3-15]|uniref:hypothetical protein n=1 Tax=Flavobacterium sp. MFBS3-15 TaxID=2989816 RepID=UPI002236B605|nr:hypothetical protein [Flavobacterium sp. MFBS3-15]MCW4468551.1 hypothetical protein [Flavobacterium sp. MFBS3-15]
MKYIFFQAALLSLSFLQAQTTLPLYEKNIPYSKPAPNTEKSEIHDGGILIISNVLVPVGSRHTRA